MAVVLVKIDTGHVVAGVLFDGRTVVVAARAFTFMLGWDADKVRKYVDEHGWKAERSSHKLTKVE